MAEVTGVRVASVERKRLPFLIDLVVRLVKTKLLGTVGGVIVLLLLLTGVFANVLAPFGYNQMFLEHRLSPPSGVFILGTDHMGRDLFSRIIYGARIAMIVGLAAAGSHVIVSVTIGTISAFVGGKTDLIIQRFVDAWESIPRLVIILTIMSILGPGMWQLIFAIGPLGGLGPSRTARSAVIAIKENVYVEAARAIGVPTSRILLRHVLPNIMPIIIIMFTVSLGASILLAATVSFLGFGIPPPYPDWGAMLSESGRKFLLLAPWMAVWPGLALSLAVYGINMLGDAMRDLLDPRLRGGLGRFGGVKVSGSVVASQVKK